MFRFRSLYFFIPSFAFAAIIFSLLNGSVSVIPFFSQNPTMAKFVIYHLRLPRTIAAFVSGGLLALAGTLMQLLLQNPLADPYILGISGGAAFATVLVLFIGAPIVWITPAAWLGSLSAFSIILILSKRQRMEPSTLLLSGVAISFAFSAAISFLLILSPSTQLHNMLFWLTGDLNEVKMPWLGILILTAGLTTTLFLAPGLNIMLRGAYEAQALGISLPLYRFLLYILSALFTATAVTFSGCIGFVGLVIPHLTRKLIGNDHCQILFFTVLLGGSVVTIADTYARTLLAPQQLPVGILLAMIGVPIFICLLQQSERF